MQKVHARFRCYGKVEPTETSPYTQVSLQPVYSDDPEHPNKEFSDATPSGNFQMSIQKGKPAADAFEIGEEYDVLISKVVKAKVGGVETELPETNTPEA